MVMCILKFIQSKLFIPYYEICTNMFLSEMIKRVVFCHGVAVGPGAMVALWRYHGATMAPYHTATTVIAENLIQLGES